MHTSEPDLALLGQATQPARPRAHAFSRRKAFQVTLLAAAVLTACGGGGGDSAQEPVTPPVEQPPVVVPTRLVGVAAIGAPMAGASVVVSDGDSATPNATATAAADGSYSVDVSALKAPLLVRASGTVNGEAVSHVAVLATVAANANNTANVTPFTTAVSALLAPGGDLTALATPATLASAATAAQVSNATALFVNTLRSDSGTSALLADGFNPTTSTFKADGTGADAALTRLNVAVQGANVVITNNAAPAGDGGNAAPVTLTPTLVATPAAAPTLPASVAQANLPTQAEMDVLGKKYQDCLALPINQRVTQDAAGTVTAVLGACNFTPADWKSNGQTFAQTVGQGTLAFNQLTGATVGAGSVVLALAPEGLTDPKAVKHPYCNTGNCVIVRFPMVTASGRATNSDWFMSKVNGSWNFVGNQLPASFGPQARLVRYQGLNPSPDPATNAYFNTDRVESVLRLNFDLSSSDTADLRAIRVTGPGLPAAGVVMVRSQRCATDDRMAITRQDGSTRVPGGATAALQSWTSGSANQFVLAAAKLDGTPLAMPTPSITATAASNQDFSPTALANPAATIPAWSRYKYEAFFFGNNTDTPDSYAYVRLGAAAENPGTAVTWPTMDAAVLSARLSPTGAKATAQTTFADTLSWTQPASIYVTSGYWFGQNFGSATNSQGETANYLARGRVDYLPSAYGDTSGAGYQFADPRAGTSMSPSTATTGANPNPRCAVAGLPAMTTSTSDYREAGLNFRGADRQVRQAIWFWRN